MFPTTWALLLFVPAFLISSEKGEETCLSENLDTELGYIGSMFVSDESSEVVKRTKCTLYKLTDGYTDKSYLFHWHEFSCDEAHLRLALMDDDANMVAFKGDIAQIVEIGKSGVNIGPIPSKFCPSGLLMGATLGKQKKTIEFLLNKGHDINCVSQSAGTLFFDATISGDMDFIKYLESKGAKSIRERDGDNGRNLLHAAAKSGNPEVIDYIYKKTPAWLNQKDDFGRTPLFFAVQSRSEKAVENLIKKGAQLNEKDRFCFTPLDYALETKKDPLIKLLKDNGALPYKELKPSAKPAPANAKP